MLWLLRPSSFTDPAAGRDCQHALLLPCPIRRARASAASNVLLLPLALRAVVRPEHALSHFGYPENGNPPFLDAVKVLTRCTQPCRKPLLQEIVAIRVRAMKIVMRREAPFDQSRPHPEQPNPPQPRIRDEKIVRNGCSSRSLGPRQGGMASNKQVRSNGRPDPLGNVV